MYQQSFFIARTRLFRSILVTSYLPSQVKSKLNPRSLNYDGNLRNVIQPNYYLLPRGRDTKDVHKSLN
ncbi:hypothetical protein RCL_jg20635.t1 [Rhizophagus clarus]|uniref:Uncharacterized protein n=1 Tax=Rhizophagus clarus TaxID=94130 RepID=A0A8H3LJ55_9GLOM|nr:hypothetical protein RCL_jg20635.t1 [Rhizophagus clarus]